MSWETCHFPHWWQLRNGPLGMRLSSASVEEGSVWSLSAAQLRSQGATTVREKGSQCLPVPERKVSQKPYEAIWSSWAGVSGPCHLLRAFAGRNAEWREHSGGREVRGWHRPSCAALLWHSCSWAGYTSGGTPLLQLPWPGLSLLPASCSHSCTALQLRMAQEQALSPGRVWAMLDPIAQSWIMYHKTRFA